MSLIAERATTPSKSLKEFDKHHTRQSELNSARDITTLRFVVLQSATLAFTECQTRVLSMDDYENPKAGKTYISPRLKAFGDSDRKVRIASKVIESPDSYAFANIKDEVVLRHKEDAKSYISAKFFEDTRGIFVLSIQGYTVATEKPHNASFSFVGDEIGKLIEFIRNIQSVNLNSSSRINITDEELNRIVLSNSQARNILHDNQELFAEVLRSEITTEDIVAVGYRKKQLDVYEKLLNNPEYFNELKEKKKTTNEGYGKNILRRIHGFSGMV